MIYVLLLIGDAMKKYLILILLFLIILPGIHAGNESSVDLRAVWNSMTTFKASKYTYGVEVVDWSKCDEVYWDGYRCVFTAGIRIYQIERGKIIWQKDYLHLKYGETEINQKFADIIIKKIKINKIDFGDGYVDLTIFYENRYFTDEKPLYEKIVGEDQSVVHIGDDQNVYSFYVSSFKNRLFYVFYVNGEKKSEEGSNILPGEKINLWLNISIGYERINNNDIFRIYAPSRFYVLKTGTFSIREKEIINVNGKDLSINENILTIGENTYPLEKNKFIVTSIGWIIYREKEMEIYAKNIDIKEYSPDLKLIYDPCSVFLNEKKTITIEIKNEGKGLGDVNLKIYGMGVNYSWSGTLGYKESKEITLEISPKTKYDTLTVEMNTEKIKLPITVETEKPQETVHVYTTLPATSPQSPVIYKETPEKKPLTTFVAIIFLTFLAIFGQNNSKKVQKNIPARTENKIEQKTDGLPKRAFKYFDKKI